jgi:hypothetical protein
MSEKLEVIGRNLMVDINGHVKDVPAKVDTGADSSAIWVSNVTVDKEGILRFTLFGEGSKYYTGEVIKRRAFRVAIVRSSTGHEIISRYYSGDARSIRSFSSMYLSKSYHRRRNQVVDYMKNYSKIRMHSIRNIIKTVNKETV